MKKSTYQKYAGATRANFTDEELKRAQENWEYGRKRFPDEHAESESIIAAKGLSGHREVTLWYSKNKMPIPKAQLSAISTFAGSTYAGPFGRGVAREEESSTAGGTKLDDLYRPVVKPEEA